MALIVFSSVGSSTLNLVKGFAREYSNWTQKILHSLPATGACSEVWHCILDTKVLAGKTNWLRVTLLHLNSTTQKIIQHIQPSIKET